MSVSRSAELDLNFSHTFLALCQEKTFDPVKMKSLLEKHQSNMADLWNPITVGAHSFLDAGLTCLYKTHGFAITGNVLSLIVRFTDPSIHSSLIYWMALFSSPHELNEFISKGVDVNARCSNGLTTLMRMAMTKNVDNFLVLSCYASITNTCHKNKNVFHYAAQFGATDEMMMALYRRLTKDNFRECLYTRDVDGKHPMQLLSQDKSLPALISKLSYLGHVPDSNEFLSLNEYELIRSLLAGGVEAANIPGVSKIKNISGIGSDSVSFQKLQELLPLDQYANIAIPLIDLVLSSYAETFNISPELIALLTYVKQSFQLLPSKQHPISIMEKLGNLVIQYTASTKSMSTTEKFILEFSSILMKNLHKYIDRLIKASRNDCQTDHEESRLLASLDKMIAQLIKPPTLNLNLDSIGDDKKYYNLDQVISSYRSLLEENKMAAETVFNKRKEALLDLLSDKTDKSAKPKKYTSKKKKNNTQQQQSIAEASSSQALDQTPKPIVINYPTIQLTTQMQEAFSLVPFPDTYVVGGAVFDVLSKASTPSADVDLVCGVDHVEKEIHHLTTRSHLTFFKPFENKNLLQFKSNSLKVDLVIRQKTAEWLMVDASARDYRVSMFYINRSGQLQRTAYSDAGLNDLALRQLVMSGEVLDRFNEDPVRILRAIKYIIKGVQPDVALKDALQHWQPEAEHQRLHGTHIKAVLCEQLNGSHAGEFLNILNEYQLLPRLLGEAAPHTLEALKAFLNPRVSTAVVQSIPSTTDVMSYPIQPALPALVPVVVTRWMPVGVMMMLPPDQLPLAIANNQLMPPPAGYYTMPHTLFSDAQTNLAQPMFDGALRRQ